MFDDAIVQSIEQTNNVNLWKFFDFKLNISYIIDYIRFLITIYRGIFEPVIGDDDERNFLLIFKEFNRDRLIHV